MIDLSAVITAVETGLAAYNAASATTAADQTAADAQQAKADAAKALVVKDQQTQNDLAVAFNTDLDQAIAAFTAAKLPTS